MTGRRVNALFSIDGPLYRIATIISRFLALNLLFLAASLPIVTVPAALGGLFGTARKIVSDDEPAVFHTFWQTFRVNGRQATWLGFVFIFVWAAWWLDLHAVLRLHPAGGSMMVVGLYGIALLIITTVLQSFPCLVYMELSLRDILLNSLRLIGVKPHLTLCNLVVVYALAYLCSRFPFLWFTFFFSVSSTITYWIVNLKFPAILKLGNPGPESIPQSFNPEIS